MYVQKQESSILGLGQSSQVLKIKQPLIQKKFTSSAVAYRDTKGKCQSTNYSIYVPSAVRDPNEIDLLVFFHGLLDVCDSAHNFNPDNVMSNFKLNLQVDDDPQLALAVPIIMWNTEDRNSGIIQGAWSAAYLNGFVEEVFNQIGKLYGVRPQLRRLILAGHSAAYDILTPLAEQFDCGVAETKNGALAKLERVLAMDTTYRLRDAIALEKWARNLANVKFRLLLSKRDPSVLIWQSWEKMRKKLTAQEKRPNNLQVFHHVGLGHCNLPSQFLVTYLYS